MARKIVHQLVDDLDGTLLDEGEGETVRFSLDGTAYEIDLTDSHAAELREAFARYVAAGRTVAAAGRARNGRRGAVRSTAGRVDYSAVRAWARENGIEVSDRGRVSADVVQAYDAAH